MAGRYYFVKFVISGGIKKKEEKNKATSENYRRIVQKTIMF